MNEFYNETKSVIDNLFIEKVKNKKKCAIFVMVQNEKMFLPIWLSYYSKSFSGEDIYIFDHRTEDGSVSECEKKFTFKNIRLEYPYSFDHLWFRFVAASVQEKLLENYEYAIFTDVDEIILPHPDYYSGLDDYLSKLTKKYVQCTGYEIIHLKEKEKPFNSGEPVLAQRNYWYKTRFYDKTLISSVKLKWKIGFHQTTKIKPNHDKNLFLIHLHKLDYDTCWNNTVKRSKLKWSDEELKSKRGWQNRITDIETFNEYYFNWPKKFKIKEIPSRLKNSLLF